MFANRSLPELIHFHFCVDHIHSQAAKRYKGLVINPTTLLPKQSLFYSPNPAVSEIGHPSFPGIMYRCTPEARGGGLPEPEATPEHRTTEEMAASRGGGDKGGNGLRRQQRAPRREVCASTPPAAAPCPLAGAAPRPPRAGGLVTPPGSSPRPRAPFVRRRRLSPGTLPARVALLGPASCPADEHQQREACNGRRRTQPGGQRCAGSGLGQWSVTGGTPRREGAALPRPSALGKKAGAPAAGSAAGPALPGTPPSPGEVSPSQIRALSPHAAGFAAPYGIPAPPSPHLQPAGGASSPAPSPAPAGAVVHRLPRLRARGGCRLPPPATGSGGAACHRRPRSRYRLPSPGCFLLACPAARARGPAGCRRPVSSPLPSPRVSRRRRAPAQEQEPGPASRFASGGSSEKEVAGTTP